ncbi:glycosyltransferase [Kineosporia sp. R_H_3]|uniref:glycosyltransferase n=1 Tax=Kineosporia sp. R_H_3 TaxID=1961848 RepID=UPI0013045D8B|nr:glycosyltransferase [Kineosporia sp. R_H_3]
MRILELTDLYWPVIGGLERFVEILSGSLTDRGHTVDVVTGATGSAPAGRLETDGAVVHRVTGWQHTLLKPFYANADRPFHPTAPDPGMMRAMRRVVERTRPDVVHAHSWNVLSMLPVARSLGVPVVVQAHDYGLACHRKTMTREGTPCAGPDLRACIPCGSAQYGLPRSAALAVGLRASRPLLRHAHVTAVSEYVARRLDPVVAPVTGRPVEVLGSFVPDGLPLLARHTAPPALPDGDVVLFVGALSRAKGVHVLLEAFRRLERPARLVLIGTRQVDTPSAADLGPDVVVHHDVPHAAVMAAMARAAVVVAPSVWPDPLPMTVTEAQLMGAPVVASRVGGIPEQVEDGGSGLLVPPGDAAALATAIDTLLGDPDLRARMGRRGRQVADRFTVARATSRVEEVLAAAAAGEASATAPVAGRGGA